MKTAIVNNLTSSRSQSNNCEDDFNLLINLKGFLKTDSSTVIKYDSNELSNIEDINSDDNSFESETIAYICGFLIKKLNLQCKLFSLFRK